MFTVRAQCARIINLRRRTALQVFATGRLLKNGSSPGLLSPTHQPSVLVSNLFSRKPKWSTGLPKHVIVVAGMASSFGDAIFFGKAFGILRDELKERLQDKSILALPPRPQHHVQSRPEVKELEKMFESLQMRHKHDVACTVYITGSPALGKTELTRQFGDEFYQKNMGYFNKKSFVSTLNANTPSDLLQSCCRLALSLGCVSDKTALEASKGNLNSLNVLSTAIEKKLKKRPGWLLILDNLSSNVKKNWTSVWPQPGDKHWGKGCVLVTTQDRNLVDDTSPFVKELYLSEGMSESDAVKLLTNLSGRFGKGAEDIVNSPSVNRVPLSVASAGLYIEKMISRNPSFSFKDYVTLIEKGPGVQKESEEMMKNSVYPYTMERATTMVTKQMAKNDPNLYKVFTLLASCIPSPVPMNIVAQVLAVQPDINPVLESVRKCALLSFHTQGGIETVSVHQLRRDIFKELFLEDGTQQQRDDLLRHIADCLSREYVKACDSGTVSSYRMRMFLLPHMEGLLQVPTTVSGFQLDAIHEMISLCFLLMEGYTLVGRYSEANDMLKITQGVLKEQEGKWTDQAARAAQTTNKILAMYKESESILKEELAIREKKYGEDSVEVANALNSFGNTSYTVGQFKENRECYECALQSYKRALQIFQQAHGYKHSTVSAVLNNLGNTWLNLGDPAKSKEQYEEALAIEEEIYGPDHPKVVVTLTNQANAYRILGEYNRSIHMYKQSLETQKRINGEDHNGVATTLKNLSVVYYHLGELHKGKEYAQEALKKKEAINGSRHPEVALALQSLGLNVMGLEELDNAQHYLQRAFEIFKGTFGPKYTISSQLLLGKATRLAGRLNDARQILEITLETHESTISSDHDAAWTLYGINELGKVNHPGRPSLVSICWELGKVYRELGYLTQSVHTLRRALDMRKQLNPNHSEVLFIQADLARALWDAGELKTGIDLMQEALTMSLSTTYSDAFILANYSSMLATMGLMLRDNGEMSQAREYLEDAIRNQEKLQLPHIILKAETMGILGTVLHRMGTLKSQSNPITFADLKYYRSQAHKHLDSALKIMKRVQYNHPVTATILAANGKMYMDRGQFHFARDSLEKALHIQFKCCGTDVHPDIGLYHTMLAEITSEESAPFHRRMADRIYIALCKRELENEDWGKKSYK